jgi:hypothetical protein
VALDLSTLPKTITDLLIEIDAADSEAFPANEPFRSGETVIGELAPYARKCFALATFYSRELERYGVDAKYSPCEHTADEPCNHAVTLERLKVYADVCRTLLWMTVRNEFNLWGDTRIGVRVGWKLVRRSNDESDGLDMLRRLLGGLGR